MARQRQRWNWAVQPLHLGRLQSLRMHSLRLLQLQLRRLGRLSGLHFLRLRQALGNPPHP